MNDYLKLKIKSVPSFLGIASSPQRPGCSGDPHTGILTDIFFKGQ
jgi:hypothetical protein